MSRTSYLLAEEPAIDLAVVAAELDVLEEYIIKDEVYRTVITSTPGGDRNLQMTGGDLLARLYRLQQQRDSLTDAQRNQLEQLQSSSDEIIKSLRTRFRALAEREIKTRLNSISWFLDDCAGDQKRCRTEFPFEIRNRQRVEELLKIFDADGLDEKLATMLKSIDQRIRMTTRASGFVWDEKIQDAFPKSPYWYLYVSP